MLRTSPGILADIVHSKEHELQSLRAQADDLELRARQRTTTRPFADALRTNRPAVIAEIKKASPSKGVLQLDFYPETVARTYEKAGAACLSVLTDKLYFQGSLGDLEAARAAVQLPVLRKDFTIDRLQILEAAAHGADAILLIAAVLDVSQLRSFRELATSLQMASLVEVHDEDDLEKAIDSGTEIVGVNNRNLDTFEVSLETSVRLSRLLPSNTIRVSESGIRTRADIVMLREAGFDAFLIGETLMRSSDPAATLSALIAS